MSSFRKLKKLSSSKKVLFAFIIQLRFVFRRYVLLSKVAYRFSKIRNHIPKNSFDNTYTLLRKEINFLYNAILKKVKFISTLSMLTAEQHRDFIWKLKKPYPNAISTVQTSRTEKYFTRLIQKLTYKLFFRKKVNSKTYPSMLSKLSHTDIFFQNREIDKSFLPIEKKVSIIQVPLSNLSFNLTTLFTSIYWDLFTSSRGTFFSIIHFIREYIYLFLSIDSTFYINVLTKLKVSESTFFFSKQKITSKLSFYLYNSYCSIRSNVCVANLLKNSSNLKFLFLKVLPFLSTKKISKSKMIIRYCSFYRLMLYRLSRSLFFFTELNIFCIKKTNPCRKFFFFKMHLITKSYLLSLSRQNYSALSFLLCYNRIRELRWVQLLRLQYKYGTQNSSLTWTSEEHHNIFFF